jgi:hypothetical protein
MDTKLDDSFDDLNRCFIRRIQESEVKEVLKRMKGGKAMGEWYPNRCVEMPWVTKLFNHIFRLTKLPDEWRRSTLVPIFKNKGDIQSCTKY